MFTYFLEFISGIVSDGSTGISEFILSALGRDISMLEETFPLLSAFSDAVIRVAFSITILITLLSLIKSIFPSEENSGQEHPVSILSGCFLSLAGVFNSVEISKYILDLFIKLQSVLLSASVDSGAETTLVSRSSLDFSGGIKTVITKGGTIRVDTGAYFLLMIVFLVFFDIFFFRLLYKMVQHYCLLGVLVYLSPLAFRSGVTRNTRTVLTGWLKTFVSSGVLLLVTTWGVRLILWSFITMTPSRSGYILLIAMMDIFINMEKYLSMVTLGFPTTPKGLLSGLGGAIRTASSVYRMGSGLSSLKNTSVKEAGNSHQRKPMGPVDMQKPVISTNNIQGAVRSERPWGKPSVQREDPSVTKPEFPKKTPDISAFSENIQKSTHTITQSVAESGKESSRIQKPEDSPLHKENRAGENSEIHRPESQSQHTEKQTNADKSDVSAKKPDAYASEAETALISEKTQQKHAFRAKSKEKINIYYDNKKK